MLILLSLLLLTVGLSLFAFFIIVAAVFDGGRVHQLDYAASFPLMVWSSSCDTKRRQCAKPRKATWSEQVSWCLIGDMIWADVSVFDKQYLEFASFDIACILNLSQWYSSYISIIFWTKYVNAEFLNVLSNFTICLCRHLFRSYWINVELIHASQPHIIIFGLFLNLCVWVYYYEVRCFLCILYMICHRHWKIHL